MMIFFNILHLFEKHLWNVNIFKMFDMKAIENIPRWLSCKNITKPKIKGELRKKGK